MPTIKMAAAPEPRKWAVGHVKALVEGNEPVADRLSIQNREVAVADLAISIRALRAQLSSLNRFGLGCPTVRIFGSQARNPTDVRWVPLDLGIQLSPKEPSIVEVSQQAERVSYAAQASGLRVRVAATKEAASTFSDIVGTIIARRASAKSVSAAPPAEVVTVTTDSDRVEVLFATGYFISTGQGFGFSTPAQRSLPWGAYIFGHRQGGSAQYEDTLWAVPSVDRIHLRV